MKLRIASLLFICTVLATAADPKKKKGQTPPEPSPLDKYISDADQRWQLSAGRPSTRIHLVAKRAFVELGVGSAEPAA